MESSKTFQNEYIYFVDRLTCDHLIKLDKEIYFVVSFARSHPLLLHNQSPIVQV